MSTNTPLRELKRQRTKRKIEDSATALVVKHGFANVTVDDICQNAEISRRSFFNYMDSKDEAVLGMPPMSLSEDRARDFVNLPSENIVRSALEYIAAAVDDAKEEVIEQGVDKEFRETLRQRRQEILNNEPTLAVMSLNRFREQSRRMHGLIVDHLTVHPEDHKLSEEDTHVEATILNGLIRESLWLHLTQPDYQLPQAGETITKLAKELTW